MSIPTDDLRTHLARELDDLGPGPDLVAEAAARGASAVRRRRALGGATLAVAAVVGGVAAVGLLAGGDDARPAKEDLPIAEDSTPPSPWDPLADGHVTEQEWDRTVSEALSASLPDRYGTVAPIQTDFDVQMFGTQGGDPRLQLNVRASGWHRSEDPQAYRQDQSCAAINQARELYSCHEVAFGDGWFAIVATDLLPPGNRSYAEGERVEIPPYDPDNIPEDWAFATELHLMNEGVSFRLGTGELGWDGISGNDPAGITDQELLAAAQEPAFLEMVEVAVQWWYDEPAPEPVEIEGELIPVMTGKGQQVPPKFPS
ncbi:hypothetical protein [Nocardioides bizhenqiangii]|uniref:Uncharacterized protein n=1 Tax=Nocardioides bizhenqiangii TaxID=3095076 RepID=A0ABZ0ZQQ9_9ACTN|nr:MULTISPECIES: hypothetical protein [unclassified Nocardioides]MDZ5619880.1 hypothetical protein [Nocardioides sp. HM23]WQQ26114.1 hypothetical protein SHK19_19390 [Nocardioides sp. HM61]